MTIIYLTLKLQHAINNNNMVENDHNLPNSQTPGERRNYFIMLRMTIIYLTLKLFEGSSTDNYVENDHNLPNSQTVVFIIILK